MDVTRTIGTFLRKKRFNQKRCTQIDDIFAAGCIFFKILTGVHPFGDNIFTDVIPNIRSNNPINFNSKLKKKKKKKSIYKNDPHYLLNAVFHQWEIYGIFHCMIRRQCFTADTFRIRQHRRNVETERPRKFDHE